MESFLHIIKIKKNLHSICVLSYVVILHILYLNYYETTFEISYNGDLYIFNFNISKYILCLLETFIIFKVTLVNISTPGLANSIMVILNLLYFIPGVVQQSATNEPFPYMLHYFVFWICMEVWLRIIRRIDLNFIAKLIKITNSDRYIRVLSFIAIVLGFVLMLYNNKSFSISNIEETLLDVYGVRADAKLAGTHWIILNIEYWVAYFGVIAITYYILKRKYLIVILLLVTELSLFLIQANRIFVFLTVAAIFVGLFKITTKKTPVFMLLLAVLLLIEVNIIDIGLVTTDVFRRFSIVPNRISGFYYDYFLSHVPDYLTSMYDRTFSFLGMSSAYTSNPIGGIIGNEYFGREVNCNTGLVGGSMFCFGIPSLVISTFGYIMSFRLYESLIYKSHNLYIEYILAVVLSSLAINTYAFLANLFNTSYFLLLFISLAPLSTLKDKTEDENIIY